MTVKTARTDALIRDIAKLFVNYPSSVWKPIIKELAEGGQAQVQIAHAISVLTDIAARTDERAHATVRARRKRAVEKSKSRHLPPPPPKNEPEQEKMSFSAGRAPSLEALELKLVSQKKGAASDIRRIYHAAGGKAELPRAKKVAIATLLAYLDQVPDKSFQHAVAAASTESGDVSDDYARWFKVITTSPQQARADKDESVGRPEAGGPRNDEPPMGLDGSSSK